MEHQPSSNSPFAEPQHAFYMNAHDASGWKYHQDERYDMVDWLSSFPLYQVMWR